MWEMDVMLQQERQQQTSLLLVAAPGGGLGRLLGVPAESKRSLLRGLEKAQCEGCFYTGGRKGRQELSLDPSSMSLLKEVGRTVLLSGTVPGSIP